MNDVTFPSEKVIANTVTEFLLVDGRQIPKHLYMMGMNRKQKRQLEAELRKKNSHIKLLRVENNVLTEEATEEESVKVVTSEENIEEAEIIPEEKGMP